MSGEVGILIGNGTATPSDAAMLDLLPGVHFYGLPEGLKTLWWKSISGNAVVKILEVR
ncbi:hypothetical protein HB770_04115 [Rhizobium leguminosarum bv. viciae]|uniref:Uncharacterized protein n=1 Tax=Rhizobium leguminosarum bv. viciae TaxID=387 RepID=A0A7G6RHU9_RHILV|nr:hypothetical protein HB770_04115 [Rhizobium leguminosarum bv. viciae]